MVSFLDMRLAREDEVVEADRMIFLDQRGDLLMAAHDRRSRAATHQAVACPKMRRDLEIAHARRGERRDVAAMQRVHSPLPGRLRASEDSLGLGDAFRRELFKQPLSFPPGLGLRVAADDMKAYAETK